MQWQWWRKYILNIDGIACLAIAGLVLYFIATTKRRTYKFDLADVFDESYITRKGARKVLKTKKVNKHEEECRRIFQDIFGVHFRSIRPKWLKNPTSNKNLELDGYNPHIKTPIGDGLAFEYDGQQHSKYTPHFHKGGVEEFEYQVAKDNWKDKKCKERGVLLIRIPHFVNFQDLERYILMLLKRKNVKIPGTDDIYRDDNDAHERLLSGGMYS